MVFIENISALKTDFARQLEARKESEGLVLGDWCFQIGVGGYQPPDPLDIVDVVASSQVLASPEGGMRWLGRVVSSGVGATVALAASPGLLTVSGLSGIPNSAARRWLRLSGFAEGRANGTWFISRWLSATSVEIYNPLVTVDFPVAGTGSWEFREACIQYPNPRALAFQCRLLTGDANSVEVSEVGIWARVLVSPVTPSLVNQSVLYCVGHFPPFVKVPEMNANLHVCCQF